MDDFTLNLYPEGDKTDFHTQNEQGKDFRPVFVRTPNEESPLSVRGSVVEVHYGHMEHNEKKCPASLVVLQFRFQSVDHEHRYKSAKITFEFIDKDGERDLDPVVVEVAPDQVKYLNKSSVNRSSSKGLSLTGNAGPQGGGVSVGVTWSVTDTYTVEYAATLTALPKPSSDKTSNDENAVTWTMQENTQKANGIPTFLQTAVLLKRSEQRPFKARIRVHSKVDWKSAWNRKMDAKTDEDKIIDPLTFRPANPEIRGSKITGIKKEDLESMEKLPVGSYFRVEGDQSEGAGSEHASGPAAAGSA